MKRFVVMESDHLGRESPNERRRRRYSGTHPRTFPQRYKELNPSQYPEIQGHILDQGRTPAGTHVPVLLAEVLTSLNPCPGEVVADCTIGFGGHAIAILERIGAAGRLVGLDIDSAELERTRGRLAPQRQQVSLHHCHFAGLGKVMADEHLEGFHLGFDIIFADLGVSSMQLDDPSRGFSYKHDGPLDMRMNPGLKTSAADLLQSMPEHEISAALLELADEADHQEIARRIVARRARQSMTQTKELVDLILEAKSLSQKAWRASAPSRSRRPELHPAARTFQALRMLVNDELSGLKQFLRNAPYCLCPNGRIGVISFHSGEDQLVADSFLEGKRLGHYAEISTKPIRMTALERRANPRSRSAMFRWAKRAMS